MGTNAQDCIEDYDEVSDNDGCDYCDGDGWGYDGETWDLEDPVNGSEGLIRCPNCHGSGLAKDMTFW